MRKNILYTVLFLFSILIKSQTTIPEPTTASIANYINAAVSPSTGVPAIGIPLYQLETNDKNFPVNVSLSYHPYNAKANIPASEVGLGWSLFFSGTISRETIGGYIDELKNWSEVTEEEADIFYYSIPGSSGKFKIYKNPNTNNLFVNNLTGEKVKIKFVRDFANPKLIINSFTITDDKGFEYLFQNSNLSLTKEGVNYINYKTSFVLDKVKDAGGKNIVSYIYDEKVKYQGTSNIIKYRYYKINTILAAKGKIKFEYNIPPNSTDIEGRAPNDPYSVKYISLLDSSDRIISKYEFGYIEMNLPYEGVDGAGFSHNGNASKRLLYVLKKMDKNFQVVEETKYEYDSYGSSTQYGFYNDNKYGNFLCSSENQSSPFVNPKKFTLGVLKKITFPTKGSVVYDFEANTVYTNKSSQDYTNFTSIKDPEIQYYATNEIPYDTQTARIYQFQVTGTSGIQYPVYITEQFIDDYFEEDIRGNYVPLSFRITNSANKVLAPSYSNCQPSVLYKIVPGTYTINIYKGGGKGIFRIHNIKSKPAPYRNENPINIGMRVKMIRSYDADGTLIKTKKYEYSSFLSSSDSSGNTFSNLGDNCFSSGSDFILYKNVKETETAGTQNNGYVKYHFKTPSDYILLGSNHTLYYNITSRGLLAKKEVYNSQNQLSELYDYDYTMEEIPDLVSGMCASSKPGWLKYTKETGKTYLNNLPYQTVSETTFSPHNLRESYIKVTGQDGSVAETTTKYATELGNARFLNANIISVPLQVETKTDGTVMTKITTKYDNTAHFYPTSVESTDLMQATETNLTFDVYDEKGNLVQVTDKSGNSVTTLWGYHKTLPIAQIAGAKYSDIASLPVVINAIAASDSDADNPSAEGALLTALENLRLASQLRSYSVTGYTYDPLIGITNSVSANGIRQIYEYDDAGRLLRIKNSEGQVLKENEYNYKNQ